MKNFALYVLPFLILGLFAMGSPAQTREDSWERSVEAMPEADGIYRTTRGLRPARLTRAAEAAFPERENPVEDGCALVLVVDAEGKPSRIQVVYSPGKGFDESAVAAVAQSEFQPAYRSSLSHDHPVPSWVDVWVPFHADKQAGAVTLESRLHPDEGPRPLHSAEAEYTDAARKKKINGNVLLTLLIDPEGMPVDIHVVLGLGSGLDENAVRTASQYRFKPAIKDGAPVPQRISMQVSFHLN